ncbi:MAG: hemolysin III [Alteromonadaceae bacterium]|nr:MAG: hemolysin III [Alteromonadaceae bacterium]
MYSGEKLNSITHLIGTIFALIGFGVLLTIAVQERSLLLFIGFCVFGLTLILLYAMSTLYHSFHPPKRKRIFQKLDHVSIYLLIAGTYTPFFLVSLQGAGGGFMLALIWSLAIIGILLDLFAPKRIKWLQVSIYLLMGWVCMLNFSELYESVAPAGMVWLVLGGVVYTVGVVFYVLDHFKALAHAHGIWHVFVLIGSFCHFVSIAMYVR